MLHTQLVGWESVGLGVEQNRMAVTMSTCLHNHELVKEQVGICNCHCKETRGNVKQ